MFYHNINPVLFEIFGFEIRYYGLFYIIGLVIAYFFLIYLVNQRNISINKNEISDYLTWLILGILIGARLFYVFVYNLWFYIANPFEAIAIWNGGLSFHGGLIGAIISAFVFWGKKWKGKISFLELADISVMPLAIALALGRVGNFINGELYGRLTDIWWAVKFQAVDGFRHPSQIYESAKNIIIFFILFALNQKQRAKLKKGTIFSLFIAMYALFRFFIEFYREPDEQLGFILFGLTMGQLLSILMFLFGIGLLWWVRKKSKVKVNA